MKSLVIGKGKEKKRVVSKDELKDYNKTPISFMADVVRPFKLSRVYVRPNGAGFKIGNLYINDAYKDKRLTTEFNDIKCHVELEKSLGGGISKGVLDFTITGDTLKMTVKDVLIIRVGKWLTALGVADQLEEIKNDEDIKVKQRVLKAVSL